MTPNPQQKLVVEHFKGPCLVTAVPGSGKTASVTERTKRLIQRGVDPKTILAITFTNKAAAEMRSRITKACGDVAAKMTISTFHSLCSRLIRANCTHLGLSKSFTIYDTDDQDRLLKTCIRKIEDIGGRVPFKPGKEYLRSLMGFIEGTRNACLTDHDGVDKYQLSGNQLKVAHEYFAQLRKSNAVDFTGLLSETLRLFKEHPDVRDKYRERFQYISVDEVQDTNVAQYELIKELALGHKNILVVGDCDQSIYKFRDACPENIFRFEKDFEGCKVLKLEINYRSTPSILKFSQNLIERNLLRKGTILQTNNPDGVAPVIRAGETDVEMAAQIAADIGNKIHGGTKPAEIVVLYRTNYASRVLEKALRDRQIKYRIIGGLSFWDRAEVKSAIAILKSKANGNDRMAFEKVCDACCKGVGDKALATVAELAQTRNITVLQAAREFAAGSGASARSMTPLIQAMDATRSILPGEGLIKLAQATAFWDRLSASSTDTNDRCANVIEMARDVDDYCSGPKNTLAGYLQNLSLLTDDENEADENLVKLMTLHGCKGLEFDVVYISHCNDGVLPHARIADEAQSEQEYGQSIEEERRLLYVGMTRARKSLSLSFSRTKIDARSKDPVPVKPSRFLFETGIKCAALDDYDPADIEPPTFE